MMENAVTTAEPSSPATPRATRMEVDFFGSRRFLQASGLVLSLLLAACRGGWGEWRRRRCAKASCCQRIAGATPTGSDR